MYWNIPDTYSMFEPKGCPVPENYSFPKSVSSFLKWRCKLRVLMRPMTTHCKLLVVIDIII